MLKYLLLKALTTDAKFAAEVWSALAKAQLLTLSKENAYILILDEALSTSQEDMFMRSIPDGYTISVISGATAKLLELSNSLTDQ